MYAGLILLRDIENEGYASPVLTIQLTATERNSKTYSRLLLCLQTLTVTSKDIKDNDNREKTTFTA